MSAQILSTGWYSQADKVNYNAYGDDVLRKSDFRPLWWHSVNSYIKPELVFVVDSASPIKSNDKEIVNTTIKLGHALGKIIVAEGVENKETLDLLRKMGCNEIQGYYFAKPMKKDKLEEFLEINQNYKECLNEDLLLEPVFI